MSFTDPPPTYSITMNNLLPKIQAVLARPAITLDEGLEEPRNVVVIALNQELNLFFNC